MFCQCEFGPEGGQKRTKEHIFGDWTTPFLKIPGRPGTQIRWQETNAGSERSSYPAYPAQQTVQGVCHSCNSGWLSRIQTAAKPFLLHALRGGKKRSYGESAQEAMAIWAYRAGLVAGIKSGPAAVPETDLHDFYGSRRPPELCRIWMGVTPYRQFTYINHVAFKVFPEDAEPPPSVNAFADVLGIGHVAFCVLHWSATKPNTGMGRVHQEFGDALTQIWPAVKPIQWPPRKVITYNGLERLASLSGAKREPE
jgi:hypothetical protein